MNDRSLRIQRSETSGRLLQEYPTFYCGTKSSLTGPHGVKGRVTDKVHSLRFSIMVLAVLVTHVV